MGCMGQQARLRQVLHYIATDWPNVARRAKQSLALVAHTSSPTSIRDFVVRHGWFTSDEVVSGVPK